MGHIGQSPSGSICDPPADEGPQDNETEQGCAAAMASGILALTFFDPAAAVKPPSQPVGVM